MPKILLLFIFLLLVLLIPAKIFAQNLPSAPNAPKEDYFKAQVVSISKEGQRDNQGYKSYFQTLKVQIEDGPQKGKIVVVGNGDESQITKDQFVVEGQEIIVDKVTDQNNKVSYSVYDAYRLNNIFYF